MKTSQTNLDTLESIIKIMTDFISIGHSLGYAKTQAFKALSIKKSEERDFVHASDYLELKKEFMIKHQNDKRWVKK